MYIEFNILSHIKKTIYQIAKESVKGVRNFPDNAYTDIEVFVDAEESNKAYAVGHYMTAGNQEKLMLIFKSNDKTVTWELARVEEIDELYDATKDVTKTIRLLSEKLPPRGNLRTVLIKQNNEETRGYFHNFHQDGNTGEGISEYATIELENGRVIQADAFAVTFTDV